jgi:hypothetical protein
MKAEDRRGAVSIMARALTAIRRKAGAAANISFKIWPSIKTQNSFEL